MRRRGIVISKSLSGAQSQFTEAHDDDNLMIRDTARSRWRQLPRRRQVTEACDDDSLMIQDTARRRWRQLPLRWHRSQRHATTTAEEQELSETTRLEQRSSIFHLCQKESTTEITTLYNILKFKGHFAVNCYESIFWSLRQCLECMSNIWRIQTVSAMLLVSITSHLKIQIGLLLSCSQSSFKCKIISPKQLNYWAAEI